ncbi:family 1 glycosylhydrolase, partial [Patescibacteria group bacterium]|nr:family 1 glycosylhydrolase [Patescibacteria group bacterium]
DLPIYITENGLADKKDKKRAKFIKEHLKYIHKAIEKGVDVRGYLHWSLIDNFEWVDGFGPRFGLVEMNYKDMSTKIRPSAREYAEICKTSFLAS